MPAIHLEIVTPERVMIDAEVDEVVVPGACGQFGVLPGHIDMFARVIPGELWWVRDGKTEEFAVSSGWAEVVHDHVMVLVDTAETPDQIDVERAKKALQRAERRLATDRADHDIDFARAELALRRALIRLQAASGRPPH